MHGPLVSVLMTSYNREKYISSAIESVLNSSYIDFELIISDDCSSDNTLRIAEEYSKYDSRIKVFLNDKNLGDYPNRNKAAERAKGKYIKYVDADDYIYPKGLEILVSNMEQFPEAGFGLCSLPQSISRPYPFQLGPTEAYEYHYFGNGLFHKAPLSAIIRKDIFDKVGGFSGIRMVGDFEMWHKLAIHSPVVLMQEGIVWYREHSEQEMTQYKNYTYHYSLVKSKALFSKECPLRPDQINKIIMAERVKISKSLMGNLFRFKFSEIKNNLSLLSLFNSQRNE